ncbi:MAG TPA: hypothetical protein VHF89_13830 [Solirubrobacteraceae bacterium]|nr:hypothetical protein [Solirubrobacteraceae bacterium]
MSDRKNTPARRAGRRPPTGLPRMVDRVMNERARRRAALLRLRERERERERASRRP